MATVYFKDGTIIQGRRCHVKRAIRTNGRIGFYCPYRFTKPEPGWYDFDYWEKR